MLHHLAQPLDLIRQIQRVLKPGGGLLVRDLLRPPPWQIPLHLNIIGFRQTPLMRKEYGDSLLAALSLEEWRQLQAATGMKGLVLRQHFLTHMSLERSSASPRPVPLRLPGPFLLRPAKWLYGTGAKVKPVRDSS
jgi:SAM-dependent methyltransferase